MKRYEIEESTYYKMICTNGFIIEGFKYDEWIEWWLYNVEFGIKQHIFTIEKDYDIKKWVKENYYDICDDYLERFGDVDNE